MGVCGSLRFFVGLQGFSAETVEEMNYGGVGERWGETVGQAFAGADGHKGGFLKGSKMP